MYTWKDAVRKGLVLLGKVLWLLVIWGGLVILTVKGFLT